MSQENNIACLLSGFLSGTLTSKEKGDLYHYIIDDSHKDKIIFWLQEQWAKELWQTSTEISSEDILAKIKADIEKHSSIGSQYVERKIQVRHTDKRQAFDKKSKTFSSTIPSKNHRSKYMFLRYTAVFVLAFGLSWVTQKKTVDVAGLPLVVGISPQYTEILVPYGSKTKVILPDSSTVWLNSGARLKYPTYFDDNLRQVFLQGEGFFDVIKDNQNPFLVNSNGLNIKVLGTKFNLKANADDDFIETTLVEGSIEILGLKGDDGKNNLVLKQGEKLTVRTENNQYEVNNIQEAGLSIPEETIIPVIIKSANVMENANVKIVTAWTENKLVFVRERFSDVKIKLERWYGVTIEVKDADILDYRFTGTFEKQTLEQAMNAFSTAASCTFRIDKNHVIVLK